MTGKVCVVEGVEDREDARNPPHVEHNGSKTSMRDRGLRHLVPSATQLQRQHASDGKAECAYGSDSNPKVLEVAEQDIARVSYGVRGIYVTDLVGAPSDMCRSAIS